MPSSPPTRPVARFALIGLLALAAVVVAVILLRGGDSYEVDARMVNASQLVEGNLVTVAGERVGSVERITVDDDNVARIRMKITDDAILPLRRGTRAIVRQQSLSGQANRYVALQLGGADGAEIESGGVIDAVDTSAAVDIDQLFNIFDPPTRRGAAKTIRLLRDSTQGREAQANAALAYLDPALASATKLFEELGGDRRTLGRFVTETSRLVTDAATQDDALAALVPNLRDTLGALADERDNLGTAVERLPAFLRRANTTWVNLRATLDDLDPLIATARPIVRDDIRPLLAQLRPFAVAAVPTARDLRRTVRRPGADNDLVELLRRQPDVADIAVETKERNGKRRPGALPVSTSALTGATPQVGFLRPYAPDLVGWFDDFSRSGAYDAHGSFSRAGLALNQLSVAPLLSALPEPLRQLLARGSGGISAGRNSRCPGSIERGALYKPSEDFNCSAAQGPQGP